jgi:hypothetical protein
LSDEFLNADAYGSPVAQAEGRIPSVAGMNAIKTVKLPTANNLVGVVGYRDALAVANKWLPGEEGVYAIDEALTDEDSGLVLGIKRYPSFAAGGNRIIIDCAYGAARANLSALCRLISA